MIILYQRYDFNFITLYLIYVIIWLKLLVYSHFISSCMLLSLYFPTELLYAYSFSFNPPFRLSLVLISVRGENKVPSSIHCA